MLLTKKIGSLFAKLTRAHRFVSKAAPSHSYQESVRRIDDLRRLDGEDVSPDDLKKLADDVPVVRIVDTLLKHAILQNASDIHIEPGERELTVRYRIDGILHDAMVLDKNAGSGITARIKVLSNLKLDEKRLPQDGRFKIEIHANRNDWSVFQSALNLWNWRKNHGCI